MIRNVKIKKALVNYVFPVFTFINKFIKKDDKTIFIYSNGNLSDNSEVLFHYLINNKYNQKYKIVCGVNKPKDYEKIRRNNVKFINSRECIFQYMKSGHVFYSHGKIPIKPTKKQIVINMWHGIPFKKIGRLSNINNGKEFFFTYVCAPSKLYRPIVARIFGCPEKNVCICGEPKMDQLFGKIDSNKTTKLIVWAPTFRQSSFLGYDNTTKTGLLPLFEEYEWDTLNEILKNNNVNMIVKLHPVQDLHKFIKEEKSNLQIYSDSYFKEKGFNLYEILLKSDALIADYSSVFLEYLVLNRPICFAIGDLEEFSNMRGFIFDNPLDYMPGDHVTDKQGIYNFIEEISKGIDKYKDKRELINKQVNYYKDGFNCKRLLNISNIK